MPRNSSQAPPSPRVQLRSRGDKSSSTGDGTAVITSDEVNYLVYRYLQESGFVHAAFSLGYESFVNKSDIDGNDIPPGALIAFLQKGLQYCEVESQLLEEDADEDERVEKPMSLLQAAVDMARLSRRRPLSKPKSKRQKTKEVKEAPRPLDAAPEDITTLKGHRKEVFVCSWNPRASVIASGSGDSTARIWELDSGSSIVLDHRSNSDSSGGAGADDSAAQNNDITTLDWNFNGTKLATGCYDGLGRVWSSDGKLLTSLKRHEGPIFSLKWNKRGDYLLSGSVDKTAIIWNAESGKPLQQFSCQEGATLDVDWRDNESFASCSTDKNIYVCQLGESEPLHVFKGHTNEVNAVKWDPTGSLLASCSDDKTAKIWKPEVDKEHTGGRSTDYSSGPVVDLSGKHGHTKEIYTLKWSPTGPGTDNPNRPLLIGSASFDTTVKLWDVEHPEACRTLGAGSHGHSKPIYSIAFSPSGEYLVSGSIDNSLLIWSVKDGSLISRHTGVGEIFEVSWSARGDKVAASFSNATLAVLDFRMLK